MSANKNNIFIQLYKPIEPPVTSSNLSPEQEAFPDQNPSEYAPIYEYIEPIIDETLAEHIQNANPPFIAQPQILLAPAQIPSIPGIQAISIPSIPLSDLEVEKELKTDVYNAVRWLAEWCLRQFQINKKSLDE